MKSLLPRIALVAGLGLLLVFALGGWRSQTKARYAAATERATAACRAYRAQPGHERDHVCRYDEFAPVAPVDVHVADAKIEEAQAALSRGDARAATGALEAAVRDAQHADRFGTVMGSVRAAGVVERVVDVLDAHRTEIDPAARRAVLAGAHLATATAPFERERIERMWVLAHFEQLKYRDVPSSEAELAAEMENDEPLFREMQSALLRDDVQGCERAASRLGRLSSPIVIVRICGYYAQVVRTETRVQNAR